MSLNKILTITFILGSIIIGLYLVYSFLIKKSANVQTTFFVNDGEQYIAYYLKRSEFRFSTGVDKLLIEKPLVGSSEFKKDENIDKFLSNWSLHNGNLYPNIDCEYVRILIPASNKDLLQGAVLFSCVDNYLNNQISFSNVQ